MNKKYISASIVFILTLGAIVYFVYTKTSEYNIPNLIPRGGGANTSSEFINAQHAVDY
jgi:hypothetical protein